MTDNNYVRANKIKEKLARIDNKIAELRNDLFYDKNCCLIIYKHDDKTNKTWQSTIYGNDLIDEEQDIIQDIKESAILELESKKKELLEEFEGL